MAEAEQLPVVPIPRYLSIHWGWLILLSAIEEGLDSYFHWRWLSWIGVLCLWGFVQAVWLYRVDKRSRALFWYVAGYAVGAILSVPLERAISQSPLPDTAVWVAVLVVLGISIAGTFIFRYEMLRFFRERDNHGMQLSAWMTFFFSILYFQYYLHDIAGMQKSDLQIAPATN